MPHAPTPIRHEYVYPSEAMTQYTHQQPPAAAAVHIPVHDRAQWANNTLVDAHEDPIRTTLVDMATQFQMSRYQLARQISHRYLNGSTELARYRHQ